jgi:hypothetical protein
MTMALEDFLPDDDATHEPDPFPYRDGWSSGYLAGHGWADSDPLHDQFQQLADSVNKQATETAQRLSEAVQAAGPWVLDQVRAAIEEHDAGIKRDMNAMLDQYVAFRENTRGMVEHVVHENAELRRRVEALEADLAAIRRLLGKK